MLVGDRPCFMKLARSDVSNSANEISSSSLSINEGKIYTEIYVQLLFTRFFFHIHIITPWN